MFGKKRGDGCFPTQTHIIKITNIPKTGMTLLRTGILLMKGHFLGLGNIPEVSALVNQEI